MECQFLSHWYDATPKKSRRKRDSNPGSSALEADALPLGQRGSEHLRDSATFDHAHAHVQDYMCVYGHVLAYEVG